MRPYDPAIDALKGVAIVGVVITHAGFARFDHDARCLIDALDTALEWSVPAFFFCAGLVARPIASRAELARMAASRLGRLLVPAFVFGAFYYVTLSALHKAPGIIGGPQIYFLPYLYVISLVGGAISLLQSRAALGMTILLAGALTLAVCPMTKTHGPMWQLAGVYLSSYCVGLLLQIGRSVTTIEICYLCFWCAVAAAVQSPHLVAAGIPPLAARAARFIACRPLCLVGKNSGNIFLLHTPILMPALSQAAVSVLGNGPASAIITVCLTVCVSLALAILCRRIPVMRRLVL